MTCIPEQALIHITQCTVNSLGHPINEMILTVDKFWKWLEALPEQNDVIFSFGLVIPNKRIHGECVYIKLTNITKPFLVVYDNWNRRTDYTELEKGAIIRFNSVFQSFGEHREDIAAQLATYNDCVTRFTCDIADREPILHLINRMHADLMSELDVPF
jgi:hypothetical protein